MAKKENVDAELGGGLSTGLEFGASRQARETGGGMPRGGEDQTDTTPLAQGYKDSFKFGQERRSIKMNVLIKPSTAKALDRAVKLGEIRSRNDLINYLLEKYFEGEGRR